MAGLAIFCASSLLSTGLDTLLIASVEGTGVNYSDAFYQFASSVELLSDVVTLLIYFWTIVFVVIYTYRANANLRSLGYKGLLHSPEVASVFWFIPILNLFKPFQEFRDIHDITIEHANKVAEDKSIGSTVGIWWGCWIAGNVIDRYASIISQGGDIVGNNYLIASWLSTISLILSAVFLSGIVIRVENGQETLNEQVIDLF